MLLASQNPPQTPRTFEQSVRDTMQYGLIPSRLARSGFVTEAAAQNIPMPETMALTGHRSPASVIGYFRQGEVLGLRAARLMEDNNAEPPEPKKQR